MDVGNTLQSIPPHPFHLCCGTHHRSLRTEYQNCISTDGGHLLQFCLFYSSGSVCAEIRCVWARGEATSLAYLSRSGPLVALGHRRGSGGSTRYLGVPLFPLSGRWRRGFGITWQCHSLSLKRRGFRGEENDVNHDVSMLVLFTIEIIIMYYVCLFYSDINK